MSILYVIYDHPADYPNHYVVRQFYITKEGPHPAKAATLHDTLEAARATIPHGMKNLGRQPDDDPILSEVWM
ncbi:hypothetical protein EON83_26535 [bacterium]|nr:MAG: hypothetical protein EON83_26535 [bacterium]